MYISTSTHGDMAHVLHTASKLNISAHASHHAVHGKNDGVQAGGAEAVNGTSGNIIGTIG